MSIINICNLNIMTLQRDDTVIQAAKLMRHHHVGDVIVIKEKDGKRIPIGIVTDRDVVVGVVAPELDSDVMTVGDIMVPNLVAIQEDAGVFDAIKLMASKGVRRLPVVKKGGELVGIVTLDDLMLMTSKEFCNFSRLLTKEQQNEATKRR